MWQAGLIKAKDYVSQKYNSVSPQNKRRATIIIIVVILILLFGGRIRDGLRKMFHNDASKLKYDAAKLTYDRTEYFSMCSTLEGAMNGSGTQTESVLDVFRRLKTQDDWYFLQKTFGTRKKDGGTFMSDITGDLKMWLSDDLDEDEMQEARNTLMQQGITY